MFGTVGGALVYGRVVIARCCCKVVVRKAPAYANSMSIAKACMSELSDRQLGTICCVYRCTQR